MKFTPFAYLHELIGNGGVWFGCNDKDVVEHAHVEGETGKEIKAVYTKEQVVEILNYLSNEIYATIRPYTSEGAYEISPVIDKVKESL